MLIFPLKKEWYEKIKNGEKTIEYREVKPYWTKRLSNAFGYYKGTYLPGHNPFENEFGVCMEGGIVSIINYCILKMGYSNKLSLEAGITKIEIVDGKNTDLATVAYMQGAERYKPKWHKAADGDLPKPNIAVLICLQFEKWTTTYIAYYRPAIKKWQMYNMHEAQRQPIVDDYIDSDEVIAWCEIPKYTEE